MKDKEKLFLILFIIFFIPTSIIYIFRYEVNNILYNVLNIGTIITGILVIITSFKKKK